MSLAPPIPTAVAPSDFDTPLLACPQCGYDLRGTTTGVCPECGEAFDAESLATSAAIPWQNRREIGRIAAFRRTVWMGCWHPGELARQAGRPVELADARRFWIVCVTLAWITIAPPAAWGLWSALRTSAQFVGGGLPLTSTLLGPLADAAIVAAMVVGLFLWLLTASGAATYFFHPRRLDPELRKRAVALGYYAAAPLAVLALPPLMFIVAGALVGLGATASGLAKGSFTTFVFEQTVLAMLIVTSAMLLLLILHTLVLPLILLSRGLHASPARMLACGATLALVAWPGLFLVFAVGLPGLVFYVQLAWHALNAAA